MQKFEDNIVQDFLGNPENFLYAVNWRQQTCSFVPAGRKALSDLPFLDNRTLGTSSRKANLPLAQVQNLFSVNGRTCDFVFHSAFCCSTLLARCLDVPGKALALKEPLAILNLSGFLRQSGAGNDFKTLGNTTLGLLSRPFIGTERVLIKPSNGANNLLRPLLKSAKTGKVILLIGSLEEFLVAVITGGRARQEFIDGILKLFLQDFGGEEENKAADNAGPLFRAALVWGLQVREFQKVHQSSEKNKAILLKANTFLEDPAKTLSNLNEFLEYGLTEKDISEALAGDKFLTHAKEPHRAFGRQDRADETKSTLEAHKDAIRKTHETFLGLSWGKKVLAL